MRRDNRQPAISCLLDELTESLRKTLWQQQRERNPQKAGLISRTMAVHVRHKSLCAFLCRPRHENNAPILKNKNVFRLFGIERTRYMFSFTANSKTNRRPEQI